MTRPLKSSSTSGLNRPPPEADPLQETQPMFRSSRSLRMLSQVGACALLATAAACAKPATPVGGSGDAASRVYVAPGAYDEFYMFASGGFSGQVSVYGLPSGRLFRVSPVFSQDPERSSGYS